MTLLGPFSALGCPFEVEASPSIARVLAEALDDLRGDDIPRRRLKATLDRSGAWTVGLDGERPQRGSDLDDALYNILSAVNLLAAREAASECAVFHGGSVALDGHGVVFVGHSRAGKSTLTAALTRAGHGYIADEVTAISSDARVRGFHRPIGLRAGGAAAVGLEVPPGPFSRTYPLRVGKWAALVDEVPLAQLVILDRICDAQSPVDVGFTPLEPAEALFMLVNHALARSTESQAFRRIEALVREVPTLVLRYTDVHEAVRTVEAFALDP